MDSVLQKLLPLFDDLYANEGRGSIPPEQLLKARVLCALYSVRSVNGCSVSNSATICSGFGSLTVNSRRGASTTASSLRVGFGIHFASEAATHQTSHGDENQRFTIRCLPLRSPRNAS